MSRRKPYKDSFSGEADEEIRSILRDDSGGNDSDDYSGKLRRVMLNVINNELTARQKEIIMLYYFKEIDVVAIAHRFGITHQAVSAILKRARLTILRYMRYYMR
ncbi:MAG: sigma-70 family RNA polymerase sigma factor [Ruminococcus sp.]|nr:sigma-70 family RNA polymerase sigma factor [Ruminococcus sp.]